MAKTRRRRGGLNICIHSDAALHDSPALCKHLLLGGPSNEKLSSAYVKAKDILNKLPGEKEFVGEHEAHAFAEFVADEMKANEGTRRNAARRRQRSRRRRNGGSGVII